MYSLVINEMLRSKKILLLGLISIVTSVLSVGLPAINPNLSTPLSSVRIIQLFMAWRSRSRY